MADPPPWPADGTLPAWLSYQGVTPSGIVTARLMWYGSVAGHAASQRVCTATVIAEHVRRDIWTGQVEALIRLIQDTVPGCPSDQQVGMLTVVTEGWHSLATLATAAGEAFASLRAASAAVLAPSKSPLSALKSKPHA